MQWVMTRVYYDYFYVEVLLMFLLIISYFCASFLTLQETIPYDRKLNELPCQWFLSV